MIIGRIEYILQGLWKLLRTVPECIGEREAEEFSNPCYGPLKHPNRVTQTTDGLHRGQVSRLDVRPQISLARSISVGFEFVR